jgi:hypothetical protein
MGPRTVGAVDPSTRLDPGAFRPRLVVLSGVRRVTTEIAHMCRYALPDFAGELPNVPLLADTGMAALSGSSSRDNRQPVQRISLKVPDQMQPGSFRAISHASVNLVRRAGDDMSVRQTISSLCCTACMPERYSTRGEDLRRREGYCVLSPHGFRRKRRGRHTSSPRRARCCPRPPA